MRLPRAVKHLAVASVFLLPACVLRLNDKNEPLPAGGVSGPAANCAVVKPEPEGVIGTDVRTKLLGRFDESGQYKDAPRFDWSGNSMNARFEGTQVEWGVTGGNEKVYDVIIDGQAPIEVVLPDYTVDPSKPRLTQVHELPSGVHEITVIRSSEAQDEVSQFVKFKFQGKQLPPIERARRIEYIGDSITCGYGDEGANATCPYSVVVRTVAGKEVKIPRTENIALAYGSLAARRLDADAVTLCYSGKGVYLNYREQNGKYKALAKDEDALEDQTTTIPDYYKRLIASDKNSPAWDFSKEPEPQVVFIHIGQNDFARDVNQNSITDYQEGPIADLTGGPPAARFDPGTFTAKYKEFVQFVRSKRPNAHIFVALPPMMSDKFPIDNGRTIFRDSLKAIVQQLNAANDLKVYFIELVEMGSRYGLGCDYHPNLKVHELMAQQVVDAIVSKTCWTAK